MESDEEKIGIDEGDWSASELALSVLFGQYHWQRSVEPRLDMKRCGYPGTVLRRMARGIDHL